METKEAIEFLKGYTISKKDWIPTPEEAWNLIHLLQQGEALKAENIELKVYRQMWDRLEHGVVYDDEGNYTYSWSDKLIGYMHRIKREGGEARRVQPALKI